MTKRKPYTAVQPTAKVYDEFKTKVCQWDLCSLLSNSNNIDKYAEHLFKLKALPLYSLANSLHFILLMRRNLAPPRTSPSPSVQISTHPHKMS